MKEEQVRNIAMSAINAIQPHPLCDYHVCYWQGRVRCLPSAHTTKAHPVFFTVVGQVLADGLSPYQWRVLTHRLLHFAGMTGLALGELSTTRVAAGGNGSGRSIQPCGRCTRQTRVPIDSPWFRIWTASGSCRSW